MEEDEIIFWEKDTYVNKILSSLSYLQSDVHGVQYLELDNYDYEYELKSYKEDIRMYCEQMEVYCRALRDKLNELD
jgi:phage host-nuclease inhibitor protein Gam